MNTSIALNTPVILMIEAPEAISIEVELGISLLYIADPASPFAGCGGVVGYSIELATDGGAFEQKINDKFEGRLVGSPYTRKHTIDLPRGKGRYMLRFMSMARPHSIDHNLCLTKLAQLRAEAIDISNCTVLHQL